jgi:16S rRNA (adenine1518-N6/adenine1519-N6)-dimethyltransferase
VTVATGRSRKGGGSLLVQTKRLLNRLDLKARKSLGQHFLVDEVVLKQVVNAADLNADDTVIEVGPGLGVLTGELVHKAGRVIVVELDDKLARALEKRLASSKNLSVVNGDILKLTPLELLGDAADYKVVANLPYYITSAVIRHFLESEIKPHLMVLMVQQEVAEAITAAPGKMSLLSVSVQFYGRTQIAGYAPAAGFYPPPEVDSAVLKIEVYPRPALPVADVGGFFRLVRAGFAAARKQLANSLALGLEIDKADVLYLLQAAGIEPKRRAETLDLDDWYRLWQALQARQPC